MCNLHYAAMYMIMSKILRDKTLFPTCVSPEFNLFKISDISPFLPTLDQTMCSRQEMSSLTL